MREYFCKKCGELDQFNFYSTCKNLCKICYSKRVQKNRNEKIDYYKAYDKKRANLPHRMELRKEVAEKWKKDPKLKKRMSEQKKKWQYKNAEKRAAHVITGNAIRDGRLVPELCKVCGKKKVDAYHEDYTKPLEVIWLCKKHHGELHKKKRG
jgi:hypothetical protein